MIRLLIVDDRATTRTGLHMLLAAEADIRVVGEAKDGQDAIDLAPILSPDVVLMDVEMPGMDGITATSRLHQLLPNASIIVLSMHDCTVLNGQAIEVGAAACVSKYLPASDLLTTIRRVAGCGPTNAVLETNE